MIRREDLFKTTTDIFKAMGMPQDDAELAADGLVTADIRGCETHGVSNMLRHYVQAFGEGKINPTPNWKITHQTSAVATIDGDNGHGLVVVPRAMDIAIRTMKKMVWWIRNILGWKKFTTLRRTEAPKLRYGSF